MDHQNQNNASSDELIKATVNLDISQALKKFTNKNIMLVSRVLYLNGPSTFMEIQKHTSLTTNLQNHALHEMKKANLVLQIDKRYYLTIYCALLLDAINRLRTEIRSKTIEDDGLFAPVTGASQGQEVGEHTKRLIHSKLESGAGA